MKMNAAWIQPQGRDFLTHWQVEGEARDNLGFSLGTQGSDLSLSSRILDLELPRADNNFTLKSCDKLCCHYI